MFPEVFGLTRQKLSARCLPQQVSLWGGGYLVSLHVLVCISQKQQIVRGKKQETTFRFIKFCAYGQKIPVNSDSSSQTQAKASSKQTNKQKQFKLQNEHRKFIFLWRQKRKWQQPKASESEEAREKSPHLPHGTTSSLAAPTCFWAPGRGMACMGSSRRAWGRGHLIKMSSFLIKKMFVKV